MDERIDAIVASRPGTFHCFHGTSSTFDRSAFQNMTYFSSSPDTAAFFSHGKPGSRVIDAVLVASKWVEVDFHGDSWGGSELWWEPGLLESIAEYGAAGDEEELAYWLDAGVTTDLVADYLNDKFGYDLVVFDNVIEEDGSCSSIYVAFSGCRAYEAGEYARLFG